MCCLLFRFLLGPGLHLCAVDGADDFIFKFCLSVRALIPVKAVYRTGCGFRQPAEEREEGRGSACS